MQVIQWTKFLPGMHWQSRSLGVVDSTLSSSTLLVIVQLLVGFLPIIPCKIQRLGI